jgi:hypothetical protein
VGAFAIVGYLAAYLTSHNGCGADSETGPPTLVSAFCRKTGLAAGLPPQTITHAFLIGALYFTPVVIVAVGAVTAAWRESRTILRWSQGIAVVFLVAGLVVGGIGAHVSYDAG